VLDDGQSGDGCDAATPDNEELTFEVTAPLDRCGLPSTLTNVLAESGTNYGKNTPNSLTQHIMYKRGDDEEERGKDVQENVLPHNGYFACGEGSGNDIDPEAPASAGLIHDVFAEYEKTFSTPQLKQKAARSALCYSSNDNNSLAGHVPRSLHHKEPQAVTDDGGTSIEHPTQIAGDDVSPGHFLRRELEDGSTSRPRQESDRQRTETEDVGSEHLSTFTSDCRLRNFYISPVESHFSSNIRITESALTRNTLLPSRRTVDEAARSDTSTAIQEPRTRKRSLSSTGPAFLPNDSAGPKRPRRATKETCKVREAREELEAKWSQASSDPHPKKQLLLSHLPGGKGKEDGRVADIKDAYLGEDGSIQCVVTWKSSLVAMENLVGGELQRRCKELLRKRYGHRELQLRAATKRQTKKKQRH
jgi:hypothetical protein